MVVKVADVTNGADTSAQGTLLHDQITVDLVTNDEVVISFEGVHTATSSFVNASLVPLLDVMSLATLKRRIKVVHSTRQINAMIKLCIEQRAMHSA